MEGRRMRLKRCTGATERRRSWNDMNHDILVSIMLRLTWKDWGFNVCYVCRSWLSALLDALFPAGNRVLDLRRLVPLDIFGRRKFIHFLRLVIARRPPPVWTKLFLPNFRFNDHFYRFLAERLPLLRVLHVPIDLNIYPPSMARLVPYWKNLRAVHGHIYMLQNMIVHCKYISYLSLYGRIGDHEASGIANNFPLLKRLVLNWCKLSMDALSLMLDSHKNLELLDTRHCYRVTMEDIKKFFPHFRAKEWNEEEIRQKASGIKIHLQCARKQCPKCSHLY